jgi:hypothetical protein
VVDIAQASDTTFDALIVTALINAAERLNSREENAEEARERAKQQSLRSQQAQLAEEAFRRALPPKDA